jgi:cobalt-zinc-cadmium efflux system membrane fusion protein
VLDILAATGEFRNDPTAPLMTVADLSDIWVTANVQE